MGRKAGYDTKPKKGPGRKARKQSEPVFPSSGDEESKKLSRHQRQRAKKRVLKRNKSEERPAKLQKKDQKLKNEDVDDADSDQGFDSDDENQVTSTVEDEDLPLTKKSKMNIFGDSDQEEESEDEETDDYGVDGGSDEDEGDIIKQSKKLEKKKKAEEEAEDAYMEETAGKMAVDIPTLEEVEEELKGDKVDLPTVLSRIKDTAYVLAEFSKRRDPNRSRSEYMAIFLKDLCLYYSYNEFLMEKLSELFSPSELLEYIEASELPRPVTIRTSTLKTRRKALAAALIARGIDVDVIGWSKVGLVVMRTASNATLGATTEYLAGHYMIQGAASFLPVMALAPKEGEKILDMCAAPGGKTTHIAAIMRNSGMLVCNDLHRDRVKALVGNLHRMGITNATITCKDGRTFPKMMPLFFDRVLLDAPCSGAGVISKDPGVKTRKDLKDIQRCAHLQKELLLAAIDATHKFDGQSGYIVYSTCSILIDENESVIEYALQKRHVKLVPTGLDIGKPGFVNHREKRFSPSMNLCKRLYPHTYNVDGFFVAKLKKLANGVKNAAEESVSGTS
ncbi:probable 28S rRNA (cytosine(4447)-C(5))-methyltransferase isoform X2 [Macrobrachium rosenbergii]|uniref:probable 28S rRNA (cytosine(4447)-C(5))-methyltransferase isoform X2 n=1 Tax=Macrobrachium rosenbergii TaxID=79674 RepID=UPI0034D50532